MNRHYRYTVPFLLATGMMAVALMANGAAVTPHLNQELAKLEAADQAARIQPHKRGRRIDWTVVDRQDADRRAKVLDLLAAGKIRTASDFLNAAVIFQHGLSARDTRLALAFATIAVQLDHIDHKPDPTAVQLMADAWDRTLMYDKQPQWYGTQYVRSSPSGPWRLYKVNLAAVTDTQRKKMGLPTLAQAEANVAKLNARQAKLH